MTELQLKDYAVEWRKKSEQALMAAKHAQEKYEASKRGSPVALVLMIDVYEATTKAATCELRYAQAVAAIEELGHEWR